MRSTSLMPNSAACPQRKFQIVSHRCGSCQSRDRPAAARSANRLSAALSKSTGARNSPRSTPRRPLRRRFPASRSDHPLHPAFIAKNEAGKVRMLRHLDQALTDAAVTNEIATMARLEAIKGELCEDEALLIGAVERAEDSREV